MITMQENDRAMPWCLFERLWSFSNSVRNVFLKEPVLKIASAIKKINCIVSARTANYPFMHEVD